MSKIEIMTKARKRFGQEYPSQPTGTFAEFGKNFEGKKTIRLTGTYSGTTFDITFAEGDVAEYDSFNYSYLGKITKIGAKTVTIVPQHGSRTYQLDLNTFMWRNHNFDLEKLTRERQEWSD